MSGSACATCGATSALTASMTGSESRPSTMTAPCSSSAAHASAGDPPAETTGNEQPTGSLLVNGDLEGSLMGVSRVVRIIAAVVCFAWVLGNASAAEASCIGHSVTTDHTSVARGDVLEIRGWNFWSECNDDGGGRSKPEANISLRIVQGDVAIP